MKIPQLTCLVLCCFSSLGFASESSSGDEPSSYEPTAQLELWINTSSTQSPAEERPVSEHKMNHFNTNIVTMTKLVNRELEKMIEQQLTRSLK